MGHFKEIEIACITFLAFPNSAHGFQYCSEYVTTIFDTFWTEPPFGSNLLLGRTSFSGMLEVVLSERPFRDQPYTRLLLLTRDENQYCSPMCILSLSLNIYTCIYKYK